MAGGYVLLTGAVAVLFALVHVLGSRMRFLQATPRSIWLSLSGGVSLAYVFVHLLPELAQHQREALDGLEAARDGAIGVYVYVTALAGLIAFHGLDRSVRGIRSGHRGDTNRDGGRPEAVFWLHLASYAVYNVFIGYLLVHREEQDVRGLVIYAIALGMHFIVNDQALRGYHGRDYDRYGRWLLALAPILGWAVGLLVPVSAALLAGIFAFLAGGIVLNVLKEELPDDRESRFWALGLGALLFTALLVLAR